MSDLGQKDIDLINETLSHATPVLTDGVKPDILQPISNISPSEAERNDMPYSEIGDKFSTSTSQFVSLKGKGDKIRFRLLGRAFINGKHFEELPPNDPSGKKWNVTNCSRINDRVECETCNKYFEIMAKAKKTENKDIIEQAKKDAKKYQAAISVYFPILNRDTAEFAVFQSKMSVKNALDEELNMGTRVYDVDWVVMRTEKPGTDYYKTSKVDSAETPPLTEEEVEVVKKGKSTDLSQLVMGTPDDSDLAADANVEVE